MSGINDGQRVNASNSNAAWLAKNGNDTTTGKITLNNADVDSGAAVNNTQGAINNEIAYVGRDDEYDTAPAYANNNYLVDGTNLTDSLSDLDQAIYDRAVEIAANTADIATNTANIATNSADILTLQDRSNDGYETHSTSATLTVSSKYMHFMTSASDTSLTMPVTTTLSVGWSVLARNTGTGVVTVQSSGASNICTLQPDGSALVTCITASGTTAASWKFMHIPPESNYESTATAGGTTTLTFESKKLQIFTGTSNQTVSFPNTTPVYYNRNYIGDSFTIINRSTGTLTVNANSGGLIKSMASGAACQFVVVATGGAGPTDWKVFEFTEAGSSGSFQDSTFEIYDNSDNTKKVAFQVSGVTTATTRTMTIPDADTTLVGTGATQTLTNKTLDNTNAVTLKDNSFTLQDNSDTSKQAVFELSGITTATTRTYTLPDSSSTLVDLATTQTLTGAKTFQNASITTNALNLSVGQIQFPASQNASADANNLDDYEEGTWTASFACGTGSATINTSSDTGSYTKIGRQVTCIGYFTVTSVSTPSGTFKISGLPFTNQAGTENSARSAVAVYAAGLTASATTAIHGFIAASSTQISLEKFTAGATSDIAAQVQAGSAIGVCITYFI